MPGPLYGDPEGPLVLGTHAGPPAGFNLRPIGHKTSNLLDVLVVNQLDVFDTKGANTSSWHKSTPGPPARAPPWPGSAGPSAGTTTWGSAGRPLCRGCFCGHSFRFLKCYSAKWFPSLEGKVVGLVPRGFVAATVPAPFGVPRTAAASILIVSSATEHLHFSQSYVQGVPRLTIPVGVASPSQTTFYINLLPSSQILVADICQSSKCTATEPFSFFSLFSVRCPIPAVGCNVE